MEKGQGSGGQTARAQTAEAPKLRAEAPRGSTLEATRSEPRGGTESAMVISISSRDRGGDPARTLEAIAGDTQKSTEADGGAKPDVFNKRKAINAICGVEEGPLTKKHDLRDQVEDTGREKAERALVDKNLVAMMPTALLADGVFFGAQKYFVDKARVEAKSNVDAQVASFNPAGEKAGTQAWQLLGHMQELKNYDPDTLGAVMSGKPDLADTIATVLDASVTKMGEDEDRNFDAIVHSLAAKKNVLGKDIQVGDSIKTRVENILKSKANSAPSGEFSNAWDKIGDMVIVAGDSLSAEDMGRLRANFLKDASRLVGIQDGFENLTQTPENAARNLRATTDILRKLTPAAESKPSTVQEAQAEQNAPEASTEQPVEAGGETIAAQPEKVKTPDFDTKQALMELYDKKPVLMGQVTDVGKKRVEDELATPDKIADAGKTAADAAFYGVDSPNLAAIKGKAVESIVAAFSKVTPEDPASHAASWYSRESLRNLKNYDRAAFDALRQSNPDIFTKMDTVMDADIAHIKPEEAGRTENVSLMISALAAKKDIVGSPLQISESQKALMESVIENRLANQTRGFMNEWNRVGDIVLVMGDSLPKDKVDALRVKFLKDAGNTVGGNFGETDTPTPDPQGAERQLRMAVDILRKFPPAEGKASEQPASATQPEIVAEGQKTATETPMSGASAEGNEAVKVDAVTSTEGQQIHPVDRGSDIAANAGEANPKVPTEAPDVIERITQADAQSGTAQTENEIGVVADEIVRTTQADAQNEAPQTERDVAAAGEKKDQEPLSPEAKQLAAMKDLSKKLDELKVPPDQQLQILKNLIDKPETAPQVAEATKETPSVREDVQKQIDASKTEKEQLESKPDKTKEDEDRLTFLSVMLMILGAVVIGAAEGQLKSMIDQANG